MDATDVASEPVPTGEATTVDSSGPLLLVEDLRIGFGSGRQAHDVVHGVGFSLDAGECLAIVGESGSGKSVTARSLVGLTGPGARVRVARMRLAGRDLPGLSERQWRDVRGRLAGLVLQDALVSLDPVRRVGAEVGEALRAHRRVLRAELPARVTGLLEAVSVPEPGVRARQYPHQLSGGLRQRVLIASAMAADPPVLIADEPTTALDVTVQARILDLLAEKKRAGTAVLLVSHDLSVVSRLADRVAVMYAGVFVEEGPMAEVLRAPAHPYTRVLLEAVPSAHAKGARLSGRVRRDVNPPENRAGCPFAHRCPLAVEECRTDTPPVVHLGTGHTAACHRLDAAWPEPELAPDAGSVRTADTEAVVEVTGVSKGFTGPDRVVRPAVANVSLTLSPGESLGVVGESGSGKSTLAQMVLGLLEPDAGTVTAFGTPWSRRPERERRELRPRIQAVPQDPLGSFDPRYTVERVIGEALGASGRTALRRRRERIVELLRLVGLDPAMLTRRPARLSGGQRQRVAIARALAREPEVLVCDEPVSALDVSVQAQILDLFADLRDQLGVALLFISHDLGVVHHLCDRVIVMKAGEVVETGPIEEVFTAPRHPYTQELLAAVPATA